MERLVTDAPLDASLRDRITVASAGNPLFVEEMLAMVREHGDGEIAVPPTIHHSCRRVSTRSTATSA
ncbi:MAG: hypothetical protein ACR2G9_08175 [Gaiellaceae bacterium]